MARIHRKIDNDRRFKHSECAQRTLRHVLGAGRHLQNFMRQSPNWDSLDPDMAEALDMIQHKIARILNGDLRYADSWHDIAGYATLVDKGLNGEQV